MMVLPRPGSRHWIRPVGATGRHNRGMHALEEIEYHIRSRCTNNVVTTVDELQRRCPLSHWGARRESISPIRTLIRPPFLQGGMRVERPMGYALRGQGDGCRPRPPRCRGEGGASRSRNRVCLCGGGRSASALPSRDSYGNRTAGRTLVT